MGYLQRRLQQDHLYFKKSYFKNVLMCYTRCWIDIQHVLWDHVVWMNDAISNFHNARYVFVDDQWSLIGLHLIMITNINIDFHLS